jgi:3-deoxy-manno-octulosonate cytidylyltransferase (CMP-KDO synthetase)
MTMSPKVLGIIPARFASSRLPGKPLALIGNKPMIQHVYENCLKALDHVYVATDDQRIVDAVEEFGGKAVMTGEHHRSGTERCAEAAKAVMAIEKTNFDVILNIQGDEPFFDARQLNDIKDCFSKQDTIIATLVQEVGVKDQQLIFDEKEAKVILDVNGHALYFSRSPIPFVQQASKDEWASKQTFYRQIGIYGYRPGVLLELVNLKPTPLEQAESLEQLRWLEHGYKVTCGLTDIEETMCVDTPEDLEKANILYKQLCNG